MKTTNAFLEVLATFIDTITITKGEIVPNTKQANYIRQLREPEKELKFIATDSVAMETITTATRSVAIQMN